MLISLIFINLPFIGVTDVLIPTAEKFKRNRLNQEKSEHFLQFLFSSGILQDVAYGVTKLKFDDNTKLTILHLVPKTKYSHAISFYKDVCEESRRKSLGLDDITAAGMNGCFTCLEELMVKGNGERKLLERLVRGILRQSFRVIHCSPAG